MTRARDLARFANNQAFSVDSDLEVGINSTAPAAKLDVLGNVVITGVLTATSFVGDGSNLSGIGINTTGSSTFNDLNVTGVGTFASVVTGGLNSTGVVTATTFKGSIEGTTATFTGNVSVGGTLSYDDVTNIDSIGIVTARTGLKVLAGGANVVGVVTGTTGVHVGTAVTIDNSGLNVTGVITATSFSGDGSSLSGVVSGIEIKSSDTSVGTSLTAINFTGATVTASQVAGISTIAITPAGISTAASSPATNTVVTLNLSTAQHHDITLTAGITTITCSGGSFGDSHSVVIIQPSAGIATVGFSTYFLFPSGSIPNMSEGSGKIDLISFVVKQSQPVGGGATELLASAGLNYSN